MKRNDVPIHIYFDMDGTLAEWGVGKTMEQVMAPGYFAELPEQKNVCDCMNYLIERSDVKVFILSCVFPGKRYRDEKMEWLYKHTSISKEQVIFVPDGEDKWEYIHAKRSREERPEKEVLIDDYSKNLSEWKGIPIKLYNGVNGTKGTWKGRSIHHKMSAKEMMARILSLSVA